MTVEQVRERVAEIEASVGDDETAHGMEDRLYLDLLRAIAEGRCADPAACAAEAIKADELDFARWCA